jgi:exodeoxyribonuclease-1
LADFHPEFVDERLSPLLLHYKARNYPTTLSESESITWEAWRSDHIQRQLPAFMKALQRLSKTADENRQFMLQELQLWAESVMPSDD